MNPDGVVDPSMVRGSDTGSPAVTVLSQEGSCTGPPAVFRSVSVARFSPVVDEPWPCSSIYVGGVATNRTDPVQFTRVAIGDLCCVGGTMFCIWK